MSLIHIFKNVKKSCFSLFLALLLLSNNIIFVLNEKGTYSKINALSPPEIKEQSTLKIQATDEELEIFKDYVHGVGMREYYVKLTNQSAIDTIKSMNYVKKVITGIGPTDVIAVTVPNNYYIQFVAFAEQEGYTIEKEVQIIVEMGALDRLRKERFLQTQEIEEIANHGENNRNQINQGYVDTNITSAQLIDIKDTKHTKLNQLEDDGDEKDNSDFRKLDSTCSPASSCECNPNQCKCEDYLKKNSCQCLPNSCFCEDYYSKNKCECEPDCSCIDFYNSNRCQCDKSYNSKNKCLCDSEYIKEHPCECTPESCSCISTFEKNKCLCDENYYKKNLETCKKELENNTIGSTTVSNDLTEQSLNVVSSSSTCSDSNYSSLHPCLCNPNSCACIDYFNNHFDECICQDAVYKTIMPCLCSPKTCACSTYAAANPCICSPKTCACSTYATANPCTCNETYIKNNPCVCSSSYYDSYPCVCAPNTCACSSYSTSNPCICAPNTCACSTYASANP